MQFEITISRPHIAPVQAMSAYYSSTLENDVLRASPTHSAGVESASFRTPERSRRIGGGSPHSASESTEQRSQAQQSSSNAQSQAELQSLMLRWNNLSASMKGDHAGCHTAC